MKKLVTSLLISSMCVGMTSVANAEETDILEHIDHTPATLQTEWVFELTENLKASDEALDDFLLPLEDVTSYLVYFVLTEGGDDPNIALMSTHSFAYVNETEEILEIERYLTNDTGEITSPFGFGSSVNNEAFIFNMTSNIFEDATQYGLTPDNILDIRYKGIHDFLTSLEDLQVYENELYYILTHEDSNEIESALNETIGITLDFLSEDSRDVGFVTLIDKESEQIAYNVIYLSGLDLETNENIASEFYSYFYDVNEYENLDAFDDSFDDEEEIEDGINGTMNDEG